MGTPGEEKEGSSLPSRSRAAAYLRLQRRGRVYKVSGQKKPKPVNGISFITHTKSGRTKNCGSGLKGDVYSHADICGFVIVLLSDLVAVLRLQTEFPPCGYASEDF